MPKVTQLITGRWEVGVQDFGHLGVEEGLGRTDLGNKWQGQFP